MASVSLNIGLKALQTAQSALDTIGHNIANSNTPGYSRQNVSLSASLPIQMRGLSMGTGVNADDVLRTVDDLLNKRLVNQISSLHRLDASVLQKSELEARLLEPGGLGLSTLLNDFFASLSSLANDPTDSVLRTGVVQSVEHLTEQFHTLFGDLEALRIDANTKLKALTKNANEIAERIQTYNQQISTLEAGGTPANDLRDQRGVELQALAKLVDVTYHETDNGALQVLVEGRLLVGSTSTQDLTAEQIDGGTFELRVGGDPKSVTPTGGEIAALLEFSHEFVPDLQEKLDALAQNLILEVNRRHSTGVPKSGSFFGVTSEFGAMDTNGDTVVTDELLVNAGLPFEVRAGSLSINVNNEVNGTFRTHGIDIDPTRMTVGDFITELNAIPGLNAGLDGQGRLQILAESGRTFDFGAELSTAPDTFATFGGGLASIGTGPGPFALSASDTLTLDGTLGPYTMTFDPVDFADISKATAQEIANAINSEPQTAASGLRAAAVGNRLFLQTVGAGQTETLDVVGGTALAALGLTGGTTVSGHETSVETSVSGSYTGDSNKTLVFVPAMDGSIGTTPGLGIDVFTTSGQLVTSLDVGENYSPGTDIEVTDGVSVSFTFGKVSASDGDAFTLNLVADSDSADILVAFGVNSLFSGSDARTIALTTAISNDPDQIAASSSGAASDNRVLLELLTLESLQTEGLGESLGGFYETLVGDVGFDVSSSKSALDVEQFLVDNLTSQRDEQSGVNVDEELVSMIQFEQAYAAAARFLQVVNTITDDLLSII